MVFMFQQLIEHVKSYPTQCLASRSNLWLRGFDRFNPVVFGRFWPFFGHIIIYSDANSKLPVRYAVQPHAAMGAFSTLDMKDCLTA